MRLRKTLNEASTRHLAVTAGTLLLALVLAAGVCWLIQLFYAGAWSNSISSNVLAEVTASPTSATAMAVQTRMVGPSDVLPTMTTNPQLPLLGRRIGLDPGHGPRDDWGAVLLDPDTGKLMIHEEELTLDLAKRARDILGLRGANVVLTRESDTAFTGVPWPSDVNGDGDEGSESDDLQARVDILNDFKAEVFLSIHANGGELDRSANQDIQVLYCGSSDCPSPAESKKLGQIVLDQLVAKLTSAGGSEYGGDLINDVDLDSSDPPLHMFVLGPVLLPRHVRQVKMPGVIGESLYVTSPEQAAQLNKDSVRQAIALAYADALQAFLTGDKGTEE